MNATATIVLPIHNGERTLRSTVQSVLNLAHGSAEHLEVVVIDDGSTDETYETACELATQYPQVHVMRQPFQRGLGAALDRVRRELPVSEVIVHDGVGPIDIEELATILHDAAPAASQEPATPAMSRGARRFAAVSSLNARMQQAHRNVLGFRRLALEPGIAPRRRQGATPVPLGAGMLNAYANAMPTHS